MTALTTFTDNTIPHQADLNNLATNIDTLCQITTGYSTSSQSIGKPFLKTTLNANQLIATATFQTLYFTNAPQTNVSNLLIPATTQGGTAATVTVPGWYRIEAQAAFDVAAQSERRITIGINGITDTATTAQTNTDMSTEASGTNNQRIQVSSLEHLARGATIVISVWQNSGASVNVLSNIQWGTWVTVSYEAPY